ncbi:MAG: DUF2007 domain-containing protein [Fidelibacterota bacterium]|nr:MAG: DUF2007 domain-containing protein [Candidatus Neomarinimicrobiota bacterium]
MTDHICIQTYYSRSAAEMDAAYLQSQGIEALVQADDLGGMVPGIAFGEQGVRLLIPKDQAEEALKLLSDSSEEFPGQ